MTEIRTEMAGNVWKILVGRGEEVKAGQELVILESMKMEIPVEAAQSGVVKEVLTEEGSFVDEGQVLMTFEE
ncbi:acetyl-CoA carboxylase biotin carboxyl carrier protein subunit [Alkalicoccus urumqiensis]|uniref:Acetyl-CoA carboxylase biotin carboxyl carrier protein subunit n=1 Tax=Alkalicoccus urumqiensis TaxID=1548213 RepID=A0A2P6MED9_ALKUR|nr:acetyl-CoA carboxylase biotin carboxyl carrier protein subunit [Alkalicoccus urumqiensis]PRO64658.1 acetyl-CoA carboxylase biotin carboxyl carrier protein subunit [Alkalicoccus urumqiensis]